MRVMVLHKATLESEAAAAPDPELARRMAEFNEQLVRAGVLLAGEGLHPSSRGKRLSRNGDRQTVTDGPFSGTEDLVSGFWLWQVKSIEEAIEWARRCPLSERRHGVEMEIRPVMEHGPAPPR